MEKAKGGFAERTHFETVQGDIAAPQGFFASGVHCGLKKDQPDIGILYSDTPANAAAVYTKNLFQAAPLKVTQESIAAEGILQAVVVNSGNANACTGEPGLKDAYRMREETAQALKLSPQHVAVSSTGVIGERLPMEKVSRGIVEAASLLDSSGGTAFAESILTTDTVTKNVCVQLEVDGKTVTIAGTAKGSGMIHPNMATMLGFVTTDANVDASVLQRMLREATDETYNMITVDGDTSTNDMVLVMANGKAGNEPLSADHPDYDRFYEAFLHVQRHLAKAIARDGEGATKLIEVTVRGAAEKDAARKVVKTVIGSNLVKSAVFGADANWGRIVCAMGYSEATFDPQRVEVSIGPVHVVQNGLPVPFDEEEAERYLKNDTIRILIDLHDGTEEATGWGCDLTYEYVRINACYRT